MATLSGMGSFTVAKKIRVYFCHPMEGLKIPDESGQRALEARKLLGDGYEVFIPEEHQVSLEEQQEVDLEAVASSDILLVDFWRMGDTTVDGVVLGRGTNQEVGFVKGLNEARLRKRIPIVQIVRQTKNFHCFDIEGLVSKNCNSLPEACKYIKRQWPYRKALRRKK